MMSERTIFMALTHVQSDLSKLGIGKEQTNKYDNYKFRGIDDVLNALAPILAKYGVLIIPSVVEREVKQVATQKGGTMNHAILTVDYTLYDADGDWITHRAQGEAMDRGDKAINKAMTSAYKYFVFQAFCIPLVGQDADSETHEIINKTEDELRMEAHLAALAANWEIVTEVKDALKEDDYPTAYEAYIKISDDDKSALNMAPTKGGKAWTTEERAKLKSDEMSAARKDYHNGEKAA